MTSVDDAKDTVRERVWSKLDEAGAVPPPGARGRIPNFVGRERAAERLAELDEWKAARYIKSNPDKAQFPVRVLALTAGKTVFMAVPRLADVRPFYRLDPAEFDGPMSVLASKADAPDVAPAVPVESLPHIDLIVCGSVAVNRQGVRIGKGAGYSDIEVALLTEAGLIGPSTLIVTTVHGIQVLDNTIPETEHDFSVDVIVTPDEVIRCAPPRRPRGLYWDHLTPEKIGAIPALAERAAIRART